LADIVASAVAKDSSYGRAATYSLIFCGDSVQLPQWLRWRPAESAERFAEA
jgi:hypothetical protein